MPDKGDKAKQKQIPLLESVSAGVGVAILAAMFGFLTYEALKTPAGAPPVLVAEPDGLSRASGIYVLEIKVINRSRKTGAAVQVEGVLKQGGSEVETSNATFDYVPGRSQRNGGLFFTRDPRDHSLELRVTGYEAP